jgi:hypothetical protein
MACFLLLDRSRESGMIDFQSRLNAVQKLIAPQEFVSIRGEVRSVNEGPAEHSGAPPVTSSLHLFTLLS